MDKIAKKMKKKIIFGLSSLSLFIFILSIYLSSFDEFYSEDLSYKQLSEAKYILNHGIPDFSNSEIINGRTTFFPPLFEYVLAFFLMIFGDLGPVLLNSILISVLPLLVFMLSKELNSKDNAAFLSAVFGGFIPILWQSSINTVGNLPFILTLFLLSTIFYLKAMKRKKKAKASYFFYINFALLCATTPAAVLFLSGMFVNLLLKYIEKKRITHKEIELFSFSASVYLFSVLITQGTFFFEFGSDIIWMNIPEKVLENLYYDFNLLELSYGLGIFPLAYGIWTIYSAIAKGESTNQHYITIGLILASLFLLWLKLIPWRLGVSILGILFASHFSIFIETFKDFLSKIRFERLAKILYASSIFFFLFSSIFPAIALGRTASMDYELEKIKGGLEYIQDEMKEEARIVVDFNNAYAVHYYTNKSVFLTSSFIATENPEERLEEYEKIYSARFEITAKEIFDKYNITHVIITPIITEIYDIESLHYEDSDFIKKIYDDNSTKIYAIKINE